MNADSVKARLKNFAVKNGCTFQEALTYYGLERTIYRISVSKYADQFVLKGGIFLYAIFNRKYERATTDVDLLARRISNSGEEMKSVFRDILSQDIDDALVFDTDSIAVEDITEFKEYHGLHISAVGYLDRTKIPVGIDIGFGDVIYPDAVKMDFPVILDMDPPRVNAYSLESSIAEKLEAIIHNGYLNSRYKDFYDIYVLSQGPKVFRRILHHTVYGYRRRDKAERKPSLPYGGRSEEKHKEVIIEMTEFDLHKELIITTKQIEKSEMTPDDIRKTFSADYGTKVDISWLNNSIGGVSVEPEPILAKNIGIIHSMQFAANSLVNNLEISEKADIMFPAIMFCYMHYLELALKVIVARNNSYYDKRDSSKIITLNNNQGKGHDLSYLWAQVEATIKSQLKLNKNESSCLDEIVDNLTKLCNTSMGYRYADDLKGNEYFDNSKFGVDLKVVCIWVNLLDEYLSQLYEENWQIVNEGL